MSAAWDRCSRYAASAKLAGVALTIALAAPAWLDIAAAQVPPPPAAAPAAQRNPICQRLEGQLAALDRGPSDARAEQIKRYEEAATKQQSELDRMTAQARRAGCEGSGFFLFGGGVPPQCDQINNQLQRMRANLDKILSGLRQLQGAGSSDRDEQRTAILVALSQNDCGPQYRTAGRPRGFMETLFGGPPTPDAPAEAQPGGSYRTLCVRTCDGSFFPISNATNQSRFKDDERACQRACPAVETALYAHRSTGEDISQAVSINGRPYTELPNAFKFRQEYNPSCTCKRADESWNEAVKDDTVERGDIVVTEEKAKALSAPKAEPPPPRPTRTEPARQQNRGRANGTQTTPAQAADAQPPAPAAGTPPGTAQPAGDAPRSVGPRFYR